MCLYNRFGMPYLRQMAIKGNVLPFPTFFPDATRGVIKTLDAEDLLGAKVEGVIVNTYHLMSQPGEKFLKKIGGIKKFMGWPGFVISDSGGFQLLSMIYKNKELGRVSDEGVYFKVGTLGGRRDYRFSPERCIEVQFNIGSDIIVCLDDCPAIKASRAEIEISVRRTLAWAKRCKKRYSELWGKNGLGRDERPKLMAIVQGGKYRDLREECAEGLVAMGFDLYGFGGWPLGGDGRVDLEMLGQTAKLLPSDLPKYALGVGDPEGMVDCARLGYSIFDCVLPTRDARHQGIYVLDGDLKRSNPLKGRIYGRIQIGGSRYARDSRPISEVCDCLTCRRYSRAYLRHLFKVGDSVAGRLATIHNLRTYTRLVEKLREELAVKRG